jgi:diguanylate cyclase (GGDEF)-like protein
LKKIASCLEAQAHRSTDLVARYGGEEFAAVLPSLSADAALEVAERLRQAVFNLNLINGQAPTGRVTISVGVASLVAHRSAPVETVIETADAALYLAKRRGRNTVAIRRFRENVDLAG